MPTGRSGSISIRVPALKKCRTSCQRYGSPMDSGSSKIFLAKWQPAAGHKFKAILLDIYSQKQVDDNNLVKRILLTSLCVAYRKLIWFVTYQMLESRAILHLKGRRSSDFILSGERNNGKGCNWFCSGRRWRYCRHAVRP